METLPVEIIELIFEFCEPKTLALSIPQVSKLFKKYSGDDSNIWKAKCEQKYSSSDSKLSEQTWKQYYFPGVLKFFPFLGFIVSKTTREEMLAQPVAVEVKLDNSTYVEYKSQKFWVQNGVFDRLYLTNETAMPKEWTRQGLSWDISFVESKELLKKKVGNYKVIAGPYQNPIEGRNCFAATITSAIKEDLGENAIYYELSLYFDYAEGTEITPGTLHGIGIQSFEFDLINFYYEGRECDD